MARVGWLVVAVLTGCGGGGAAEPAPVRTPEVVRTPTVGDAIERGPAQAGLAQPKQTAGPHEPLAMRKGEESVQVEDVVITREPGRMRLWFLREYVGCETAAGLAPENEEVVAVVPLAVEPGEMPAPGPQPPAEWTYHGADGVRVLPGSHGWVRITRTEEPGTVEGRVSAWATVEDERFELRGPFTATVCQR